MLGLTLVARVQFVDRVWFSITTKKEVRTLCDLVLQ